MATDKKKGSALKVVGDETEGIVPADGKEPYADIRKSVIELKETIDKSRWRLAEVLFAIHDQTIFQRWGYNNFDQYVSTEVKMTERTAQYLVSMYGWFVHDMGPKLSEEDRKEMIDGVRELGWTKARSLIGVTTPENVQEWIEKAKKLSSTELQNAVKKALVEKGGGNPSDVKDMKRMSVAFADEQYDIVQQALGLAEQKAESNKKGHLLSLICQDFVATTMAQTDGGQRSKGKYFDKIGAQFGVRLIAVDIETKKVVHNKKVLEGLQEG